MNKKVIQEETFNWEKIVYRDKLGRPIETDELDLLLRNREYVVVKQDVVNNYFVSTIWLGVPFGLGIGAHQYFETIVFDIPPTIKDPYKTTGEILEIYRYHNLVEAEAGHEEVIKEWKQKI